MECSNAGITTFCQNFQSAPWLSECVNNVDTGLAEDMRSGCLIDLCANDVAQTRYDIVKELVDITYFDARYNGDMLYLKFKPKFRSSFL